MIADRPTPPQPCTATHSPPFTFAWSQTARNEVANRVARALAPPYGAIQSDHARDVEGQAPGTLGSFAAVLLFYAYWRTFDRAMIEAVRVGLERAVTAEPDYAEALACLSLVYSNASRVGTRKGKFY